MKHGPARQRGLTERGRERHRRRLPAEERREDVVEAALAVFSSTSYAGATTAGIAREAGVSEPILYRHFPSKKALYVACLDASLCRLLEVWDEAKASASGGPADWLSAMTDATIALVHRGSVIPHTLWLQAFSEAGDDPEIAAAVRRVVSDVHAALAATIAELQAAGVVAAARDAEAEGWILLSGMLMQTFAARVGGIVGPEDRARIRRERLRWLTAAPPDA